MPQQQLFRESVPVVGLAETRTARAWDWVCGALVHNDKGECAVSILDTVFIEKQQIWSWFSSASGGVVRKKPHTTLHIESVQDAFVKIAHAYAHNSARYVAVCLFGDQVRTMQVFGAHELLKYLNSPASSDGSACVSAFVTPRGDLDPIKYANLEHVFTLSKSGRPQFKLFRLALGSQKILSMDAKMNTQVNEVVQRYISFVERNKKVRVVHCVSLFVLDDYGRLFLWRTESCETIPGTSALLHAPSNSGVHTSSPSSTAFMQSDAHRSYEGPHAVNERILARAKAEAMRKPDEKLIGAILSSPTPQQRRPQLLSTSSSVPNLGDASSAFHSFASFRDDKPQDRLRNAKDWDDALQFLPSTSSLSRGRRRTISAAHLISSQKKGCCGDYCHFEMNTLAAKRLEGKKSVADQPFLKGDDPMRHRSSVFTATAAAIAFMESRGDEDPLKFQPRVGNQSSSYSKSRKPSSPQKLQHDETVQSQFTIPFKLIAQTRAEKQLVDLFIRRYRNGEDGDYLAEEYYGDGEPLGQTFPGYYYQGVQVCEDCFTFYTLVEKVRMQALDQIAEKRSAKSKILGTRQSTGRGKSRVGSRCRDESIKEQDERDEIVDPERHDRAVEQQKRRIWAQVWAHADSISSGITKSDAAELYSFVNPHPAIEMVLSSLGIMILGKEGAWTELKRAISQEKLLGLLQKFELNHLSLDVVMKAASHARNHLFSPIHIAPISSCAARFCDWVLSVLQAYAWKNQAMFKDRHTNRVLRFLKPELLPESISRDELTDDVDDDSQRLSVDLEAGPMPKKTNAALSTAGRHRHQKDAARRAIQVQQMARLAAPLGLADAVAQGSSEAVFTCQDGVTKIPYAIVGQAVGETTKCNLVVFHDLFDTLDSTKVFFRSVLARNVGARALFFNFPGQAGTSYSDDTSTKGVLNNTWQARRVHELLNYLQHTKAFITSGMPFHIVGFGNGANIAACYTILHGKAYEGYLQSLMLCNGFAKVDAQMAAILHSAVNVFSCFPPSRPDLPVTFFCKFLFSDGYLAKIDPNLALSIYTAVTNSITLDGRIRMCQGALHHMDLVNQLQEIEVPLVLVQSVENAFVAPASVDPFLQGRTNIFHAWSHQQPQNGDVRGKTSKQLRHVLATPKSAFVSWLRAGHELRQECKAYITDLLELLVNATEVGQVDPSDATPSQIAASIPKARQSDPVDDAAFGRAPRQAPDDTLVSLASSTAKAQSGSQPSSVSRPLRESLDAPLVAVPTHAPITTHVKREPRPAVTKSVYELQLERSEQEFQEAIKTHEAHKAELKRKQAQEKQAVKEGHLRGTTPQQSSPRSPFAARGISQAVSPEPPAEVVIQKKPPVATAASFVFDLPPPSLPERTSHALSTNKQQHEDCSDRAVSHLDADMDAVRAKMLENEQRIAREAEQLRAKQRAAAEERMEALRQEQERRRREWEEEDAARLAALEKKLQEEQTERLAATKKREMDLLKLDMESSMAAIIDIPTRAPSSILRPTQQTTYASPASIILSPTRDELNDQIRLKPDLPSVFDQLEAEEKAKKRIGKLRVDDFNEIKQSMARTFNEGVRERENSLKAELMRQKHVHATCIQKYVRRYLAVRRVGKLRNELQQQRITRFAGDEIVRIVRGFLGRRRFKRYRVQRKEEALQSFAAVCIQRMFRGHTCRVAFVHKLRAKKAMLLQRVYRGHMGRMQCLELREAQVQRRYMDRNAAKIQATWKMYIARDRFLTSRFSVLAAIEIQRMYRGHIGRLEASRKKQWRDAEPGPARLALGLKMIEGSKQAFERQQNEIDALHRAQEAVERQVSTIHSELQESEQELAVLERELQEIDQLEMDLRELTHEAEMLHNGGIEGLLRAASSDPSSGSSKQPMPLGNGIPPTSNSAVPYENGVESLFETKDVMKKRQADAYAVEMAIQIKRAEREKKKKDLEAEFTSVFSEVQLKRQALADMEDKLADMEATRMRKDREFARLQRNLMELLEEQKLELENLREKGIELETATATSAAAAAATAMKAKEHEKRSQAMFESTEELMKFQFMSMSLSYFSSLNMLKNLRDINADTTSAAITSTAETAAAAAAAAAAANIPSMARLKVGGADLMLAASQRKQQELADKLADEDEAKKAKLQPLPPEVRDWNVDDVGRWLDSLSLSQYKQAFREGAVDGDFLLELRAEDMSDVLGVTHKLHVRKLLVARNKLLPLTVQEKLQLDAVQHEESSSLAREQIGKPDLDTVFSQARNGRLKRLMESVDAGFDINEEDDKGNTLLLIACQNVNMKMVEYLLAKRANVNHRNTQGNTPLHFAMAYDADGALGEYLIARGADDTIENVFGLTPYDGLTAE
uniref:SAM domain-containing protein n=1 Tax=Globisporangium ultimum (strain ATCC 200006 / CBS 805.95 / DAOM BR144) TaxID=431595 RepID=K3WQ57_GLOUD